MRYIKGTKNDLTPKSKMPVKIEQKIQQIKKDLIKGNYELVKVKETTYYKSWKKKLMILLKECEQLQNV